MVCALLLTLSACEKREAKKPTEVKAPQASGIISDRVPPEVADLATGLLTDFGKDKIVIKAVKAQNAEGLTKVQIKAKDEAWQAAKKAGETDPLMKAVMENPCAKQLKKLMAENSFITEIFVTDNQGANVCQTGLTGDYWQGDEAKFKEVFKKGILVSHPEMEDGMNITQVSVPVTMGKRHIGTMTIGVNIDKVSGVKADEKALKEEPAAAAAQPGTEEPPPAAAEAEQEKAPGSAAAPEVKPPSEVAAPGEAPPEQVEPTQEKAPEKEAVVVAEAPVVKEVPEVVKEGPAVAKEEPPSEMMEEAKESASKVTEEVQALADTTLKASEELATLPAQVKKIQQEAGEVQEEVEEVAAQVKKVSEKVEKVSMESQQVLDKARNAMEQVLQARAKLRDAADEIQQAAALMTQKLAEIESLTGEKTSSEKAPPQAE